MKPQPINFEPIQEYPTYTVGWVIHNGERLYRTTQDKPRTDAENRRIIAQQRNNIKPLTPQEKKDCRIPSNAEAYRIPDDTVREIRRLAANKVLRKDISAMFDISEYQIRRIVNGESYGNVK